jgi:hypothetical protein
MHHFVIKNGPVLVLALFVSRLLSEAMALYTTIPVSILLVLSIIAVFFLVCRWALRPFSPEQTWPLWLLLGYVVYPDLDWRAALVTTAVVLIVFALQQREKWQWLETRWCKTAVFTLSALIFLTLYILTLAPDILPADNGEYQMVAAALGVAHPPGFPLYTLLGHLFTKLPFGDTLAFRVNLLSAFTSTATLLIVLAAVYRLTKSYLGAITAVLTLASATTFWAQATTANIRSLTALFAALAIFTLIGFRNATRSQNQQQADRWLILFALAMGFGLAHHLSLAFMALVFLLFIVLADPTFIKTPRRWLKPILAGLLGFLPLLYLPLRAGADVPGATADLATLNGFLNHTLGLGFSGDFFYYVQPNLLWQRLLVMGNVMTFQFAHWLIVGMVLGLLLMLWRDRLLALLLGGSFAIHLFITATYRAPQTVEYMLPAYIPAVICLGYAVGFLVSFAFRRQWATAVAYSLAAIFLVTAVRQTISHYPSYEYLSHYTVRDTVQPMLADAPADSIILADWHWATPLWYLQEVEKQRPDVTVEFVYPRSADYGADWATRIQGELENGRSVISTHFEEIAYASLPPTEPYGDAFLFRQEPRTTLPDSFTPLDMTLGDTIQILGYELGKTAVEIGEETTLTVAWQPIPRQAQETNLQSPISLFAHLVSFDGQIHGQQDVITTPQPGGITLTQLRLTPRPGTQPGDYAVMIGAYNSEPFRNSAGESRIEIANLPVKAMSWAPYTQNPVKRPLADRSRTLIGYDWDTTSRPETRLFLHWQTDDGYQTEIRDNLVTQEELDTILSKGIESLPLIGDFGIIISNLVFWENQGNSHYVPLGQGIVWIGENLTSADSPVLLPQYFGSSHPLTQDLVVSARLIGYEEDGFHWAWTDQNDSIPAMGAIPSLKWIAGSEVRSPHFLTVSDTAENGQTIGATLRLYDAFTNRPLPILDERIANANPWIPIGQLKSPEPEISQ